MTDPHHLLLRSARPDDLDALERFAAASAIGITTLPADRARLADRLARSAQAVASQDDSSGEEIYLFALEDLQGADEAFVTGTFGGVTPVREIDGRMLPTALPGPVTAKLRALYEALKDDEAARAGA